MLTEEELAELSRVFPEMDWMDPEDWQKVAAFAGWRSWVDDFHWQEDFDHDETRTFSRMLKLRENRIQVRKDCRSYYGVASVPNINDTEQETWT